MTERHLFVRSELTCHLGVLLMESHGLAPNVRSASFSSVHVWSKLYQAGPYFVDLILGPGTDALALHGELMADDDAATLDQGTVSLRDQQGAVVSTTTAHNGTFSLQIEEPGSYQLDLTFDEASMSLLGIDI